MNDIAHHCVCSVGPLMGHVELMLWFKCSSTGLTNKKTNKKDTTGLIRRTQTVLRDNIICSYTDHGRMHKHCIQAQNGGL